MTKHSLLCLAKGLPADRASVLPFTHFGVCRVVAGQWLGPWVLCKALAAAAAAATANSSLQQQGGLGLCVHVACDPGGGAPELDPDQLQQLLPRSCNSSASGASAAQQGLQEHEQQHFPGVQQQQQQRGLLLLVPLTLGVGKVRWGTECFDCCSDAHSHQVLLNLLAHGRPCMSMLRASPARLTLPGLGSFGSQRGTQPNGASSLWLV